MDLISVAVITYNSSKTIIETLDSIYNQTYANLELIISDDCSTDNTIEIVKRWARKHYMRFTNVRILKARKNHGVTKNCNIAVYQAHGKYIQIIAGDDILLENAIEKKYNFAESKSLVLVCSKVKVFGTNKYNVAIMTGLCEKCYDIIRDGWKEQYENILNFNFVIGPMCGFYLLKYLKEVGAFDIRFPMLEDHPFMFRYIVDGNEIELLDEVCTQYRISSDSISIKKDTAFNTSVKKFTCYEVLKELIKHGKFKVLIKKIQELL